MTDPTPEQTAAQLWHLALSSTGNEFIAAAEAAIYAAIHTAELAQAERDARLCEMHIEVFDNSESHVFGGKWKLILSSPKAKNHTGKVYAAAIREAANATVP